MQTHLTIIANDRDRDREPTAQRAGGGASSPQLKWLKRGLKQPGGKLPLFDEHGQRVSDRTVQSCVDKGWAEPWFANPIKPDWRICRLTDAGRRLCSGI